ncbi:peptide chain release factor 1 [Kluyveromyces marxianus]|uniref:Peptide chain release factor 1 n=1 Tax=Kluyveromyces marxianus TaxID=4911 RepID=A0ABX6F0I2_KLUMA|nr:peptide chain release factor 1 [Kluyveromyces marxianus]
MNLNGPTMSVGMSTSHVIRQRIIPPIFAGFNHFYRSNVANATRKYSSSDVLEFKPLHSSLLSRARLYEKELRELEDMLSQGGSFDLEKQKKFAKLSTIVDAYSKYQEDLKQYNELQEIVQLDPSLKEEAESDIAVLLPELDKTGKSLASKLLPPHPFAEKPSILELRPGVGGSEAMIFTQDLLNMYINYANYHRWKWSLISKTENASGTGVLEAILNIDEPGSYDKLKFEAGVHRVQRVPATETKGRTHTSTAAVVVLPKMGEESESDAYERTFKPDEIRIDVMRASGKGGQHVNTTDSAVRLTHYPSGIVISMQEERSQHRNKAKAFAILRARLAEKERLEKEEKERNARKDQVSSTDRSDKIRTYNYPQNRITDHRCGYTLYDIEGVMKGERLDDVIDALEMFDADQKSKLLLEEMS